MSKKLDLVAVGNISIDSIKVGDSRRRTVPGGSPGAVLTAATACSASTGILTRFGWDFPKEWKKDLKQRGIDLAGARTQKMSCRFDLVYNKRGGLASFNEMFSAEDSLTPDLLPKRYLESKHIHLCAAHPQNQISFLQNLNSKAKKSLTLWPTYESEYDDTFRKALKKVHILFCNNHEAKIIAKKENIYDAVKAVQKNGPDIVVLTKGSKGSSIYHKEKFYLFPALNTSKLDGTGCGDAFAGGFLAEYLRSGNIEKAGWTGVALASFTISKFGSWFPADVSQEKIDERIERAKKYSERDVKKGTLLDFF